MGSCESGVACAPYPGLADLYFASAHGCKTGSFGLKVIRFCFCSQTPDRSRVELPLWFRVARACLSFCANVSRADENTIVIASAAIELGMLLRKLDSAACHNFRTAPHRTVHLIASIVLSIAISST